MEIPAKSSKMHIGRKVSGIREIRGIKQEYLATELGLNHGNEKQEIIPAINAVPVEPGTIKIAVADSGYYSESNVIKAQGLGLEPIVCPNAEEDEHSFLENHLGKAAPANTAVNVKGKMTERLKTDQGREIYKKRKQIVEPVFGIIKKVLGFRRFLLRGEQQTNNESLMICSAYNLKRMFNLKLTGLRY
ncbi:transposase [Pedobacter sp. L105]|uniref:transposase n=1 Tax=Pedobacter sp. L105 TaxID=1641871 RepID=UPI00131DAEC1|nr:transposase [Pedobacter sp. L105]